MEHRYAYVNIQTTILKPHHFDIGPRQNWFIAYVCHDVPYDVQLILVDYISFVM